ncbi:hypothetical protein E2C01_019017 [Portunus trituberculatus]|uniref:Uncharacterized protein n=1 Tax=Portunus trituberculatus TaxID=210409 RepID=A0A5B7DY45_PORTR|nr:hypothetical protein [Portunus trituberculatus]
MLRAVNKFSIDLNPREPSRNPGLYDNIIIIIIIIIIISLVQKRYRSEETDLWLCCSPRAVTAAGQERQRPGCCC